MISYLTIFLGGGLGSCLRVLITQMTTNQSQKMWVGTLLANALGCLIFFLLYRFSYQLEELPRDLIFKGFLGALTTFSTFSFEVVQSIKSGNYAQAITIFLLNMFFGIVIGLLIFDKKLA